MPAPAPVGAHRHRLLTRRVWLPRWLYELLPALYLLLGAAALAAGLLVAGPAWIVPLALVAALGLVHLGLWVATVRFRYRQRTRTAGHTAPEPALGTGFR